MKRKFFSKLLKLLRADDLEGFKKLVDENPDINLDESVEDEWHSKISNNEWGIFVKACEIGAVKIVEYLLNNSETLKINLNVASSHWNIPTPLSRASLYGHDKVVKLLLANKRIIVAEDGTFALWGALQENYNIGVFVNEKIKTIQLLLNDHRIEVNSNERMTAGQPLYLTLEPASKLLLIKYTKKLIIHKPVTDLHDPLSKETIFGKICKEKYRIKEYEKNRRELSAYFLLVDNPDLDKKRIEVLREIAAILGVTSKYLTVQMLLLEICQKDCPNIQDNDAAKKIITDIFHALGGDVPPNLNPSSELSAIVEQIKILYPFHFPLTPQELCITSALMQESYLQIATPIASNNNSILENWGRVLGIMVRVPLEIKMRMSNLILGVNALFIKNELMISALQETLNRFYAHANEPQQTKVKEKLREITPNNFSTSTRKVANEYQEKSFFEILNESDIWASDELLHKCRSLSLTLDKIYKNESATDIKQEMCMEMKKFFIVVEKGDVQKITEQGEKCIHMAKNHESRLTNSASKQSTSVVANIVTSLVEGLIVSLSAIGSYFSFISNNSTALCASPLPTVSPVVPVATNVRAVNSIVNELSRPPQHNAPSFSS